MPSKIDLLLVFLADMRKEQKDDHDALAAEMREALKRISDHETRIVVVEGRQKTARWAGGALVVAFLTFLFDVLKNHVPNFVQGSGH